MSFEGVMIRARTNVFTAAIAGFGRPPCAPLTIVASTPVQCRADRSFMAGCCGSHKQRHGTSSIALSTCWLALSFFFLFTMPKPVNSYGRGIEDTRY